MKIHKQAFNDGQVEITFEWPELTEIRQLNDEQLQRFSDWAQSHWTYHIAQSRCKREKDPVFQFMFADEIAREGRNRDGEPTKADQSNATELRKALIVQYGIENLNKVFATLVEREAAQRPGFRYAFEPDGDQAVQASEMAKFTREVRLRAVGLVIKGLQ